MNALEKRRRPLWFLAVVVIVAHCAGPQATVSLVGAAGSTYYVHEVNGSDSNPGTLERPWRTVQKAADILEAGDTVYIRGGTYRENIRLAHSGTADNYITYAVYPGEEATIDISSGTAIALDDRKYIVIDGLTIEANGSGLWIAGGGQVDHIVIKNCNMRNSSGNGHGMGFPDGSYLRILDNVFYRHGQPIQSGADLIMFGRDCHHNLVEGNEFRFAQHALIGMYATSYNVIRGNYFENQWYRGVLAEGRDYEPGPYNLWENNVFGPTDGGNAPGLALRADRSIIRGNIFVENQAGGISVTGYDYNAGEAMYAHDNRVYDNVFYRARLGGVAFRNWGGNPDISGNVFKNNVLYKNRNDWEWLEPSGQPQQIFFENSSSPSFEQVYFLSNCIFNESAGENVIGVGSSESFTLSSVQSSYPNNFANNVEVDPGFVDAEHHDFRLRPDSALIDAGASLTRAASAGSGTRLAVEDALYFSDGFGIVEADWIKIGNGDPVQIASVDYDANTINLTESRSWDDNSPVYLYRNSMGSVVLSGNAPDIGAHEYAGASQPTRTPTPTPIPNPTELIIDDSDDGFSTTFSQDTWQEYAYAGGQHYGDTHYYNRQTGDGQDIASWTFSVPEPGMYEVAAWWWDGSWRPSDVPYTVNHLDGATIVRVSQQVNGGQWNPLGIFSFHSQGSVTVSDDVSSGEDVVADGIRLVYLRSLPSALRAIYLPVVTRQ